MEEKMVRGFVFRLGVFKEKVERLRRLFFMDSGFRSSPPHDSLRDCAGMMGWRKHRILMECVSCVVLVISSIDFEVVLRRRKQVVVAVR